MQETLESSSAGAVPGAKSVTRRHWVGRVLSGLAVAFLLFDTWMSLAAPPQAIEGTKALGFQEHHLLPLGILKLVLLALYLVPRTAPLGAVLWTGYLGGAVAAHVRLDNPVFSHMLFPIYVAAFLWGGLYLRDARVRGLIGPAR